MIAAARDGALAAYHRPTGLRRLLGPLGWGSSGYWSCGRLRGSPCVDDDIGLRDRIRFRLSDRFVITPDFDWNCYTSLAEL